MAMTVGCRLRTAVSFFGLRPFRVVKTFQISQRSKKVKVTSSFFFTFGFDSKTVYISKK
jgi:hypothetical protein